MSIKILKHTLKVFLQIMLISSILSTTVWAQGASVPSNLAFTSKLPGAKLETPSDSVINNDNTEIVPSEPETPIDLETDPSTPGPQVPETPLSIEGYPLVQNFATPVPDSLNVSLKYQNYLLNYDYIVSNGKVSIRSGPGSTYGTVRNSSTYEKLSLVEAVKGEYIAKYNTDVWFRVYWYNKGSIQTGYVYGGLVSYRGFELNKKLTEAKAVQADLANATTIGYVNNYKNRRGTPPALNGKSKDVYGNDRSQSAPGYSSLKNLNSFVYVQDGTLLLIIGQSNGYYQCRLPGKKTVYWVPQKYISINNNMKNVSQMVVIDRKQQNTAVFEKSGSNWNLVSYQVVTTGASDKYRFPTPLGAFMSIEKKSRFIYLDDVTQEVDGYAPYAVRFSGGAYLHGVPVAYKKDTAGNLKDPGMAEILTTLGTVPRSHKCVRNYTSHAKFLYDWTTIGKSAVIVIE